MIRQEIKSNSVIGKNLSQYTEKGALVPDNVVTNMILQKLKDSKTNGFILDGFPRNLSQAQELDKVYPIDLVVQFEQNEEIIISKLSGRRTCEKCGKIYNYAHVKFQGIDMPPLKPKKDGICDECGSNRIVQRIDDTEEVIRRRLKDYQTLTLPLVDYYKKKHVLKSFLVNGGVKELLPELMKILQV